MRTNRVPLRYDGNTNTQDNTHCQTDRQRIELYNQDDIIANRHADNTDREKLTYMHFRNVRTVYSRSQMRSGQVPI